MAFPELRRWIKEFRPDRGEPISLNLKSDIPEFDPVNVDWYARNGYPQLYSLLGGGDSAWSGETVSRATALTNSTVWGCNRVVSGAIGYIPASLKRQIGDSKQDAVEHPMFSAMKHQPNDEITAQGFREMLTSHCLLEGNAFSKIIRRSGTGVAVELQQLLPEQVTPDREKSGQRRLVYVIHNEFGAADKTYTLERGKPQDILHLRGLGWDGLRGYSVIQMGRQSMGMALAAERNAAMFWRRGGRPPLSIEKAKFKTAQEGLDYAKKMREILSDPHNVPVFENEQTLKPLGSTMVEAQALESRQFTVPEICRWFSVSPHLVSDLTHGTFSNVENLWLQFVKMTLSEWLGRWEDEFRRCVLTPEEKTQGYFLHHNLDALLRGDYATRMAGYVSAIQNGWKNADEIRDLEDDNPLPNGAGKAYRFQLNMQTTPGTGAPTVTEQGILNRMSAAKTPTA